MKWFLDIAYIGLAASYKWILVGVAVIGILVGVLFAAGVLGGGDDDPGTTVFTPPDPLPTVTPAPTATIPPRRTPVPTRAPTATPAPVVLPTSTPPPTPTPTKVVVVLREIQVPINLVGAENVGSLEFVLVYEPEMLEVTDVQPGSLAGQALLEFNATTPGLLWTGVIDADGVSGDGPVAIVTFTVKRGVGDNSQLSLQNVVAYDAASLLDIIVEPSPGDFSARENIISIPYLTFTP
jgi:hypothetical protein